MEDSEDCGGNSTKHQVGRALTTVDVPAGETWTVKLTITGQAESLHEEVNVYHNGDVKAKVRAIEGCAYSCQMCPVDHNVTLVLNAGRHEIVADFNSWDDLYHKGAYFKIDFEPQSCSSCACTPSTVFTEDPKAIYVYRYGDDDDGLSAGAIVGIVFACFGAIVCCFACCLACCFVLRRRTEEQGKGKAAAFAEAAVSNAAVEEAPVVNEAPAPAVEAPAPVAPPAAQETRQTGTTAREMVDVAVCCDEKPVFMV